MTPPRPRFPDQDEARIDRAVARARERLLKGGDATEPRNSPDSARNRPRVREGPCASVNVRGTRPETRRTQPGKVEAGAAAGSGSAGHAAQAIEAALRRTGWSVERREPDAPPCHMAQLAAAEPDARRIIIYIPCLRWMAERADSAGRMDATAGNPKSGVEADSVFSPEERLARLEALALAHEAFHAMDEEERAASAGGTFSRSLWDGPRPSRATVEEAARRFAAQLVESIRPPD